MATNPQGTAAAHGGLSQRAALGSGIAVCAAIAVVALFLGAQMPLIGGPIFAIIIGLVLANIPATAQAIAPLQIKTISGMSLRVGIVLLGATLSLADVARTGLISLEVLAVTMSAGLLFAAFVGKAMGVDWRMRCLIGVGTTICGASAIAAVAPVIRAKSEEIAYAIPVIFLFNMLAVVIFPIFGHAMGLSDYGFGMWAGTAVNDTSAVVAAGFGFSQTAGEYATIVKLTRTTLIIPITLALGLMMPWLDPEHPAAGGDLMTRVKNAIPVFIGLFVLASLINTLGLIGSLAPSVRLLARFVFLLALAGVGLQCGKKAFIGAGFRPLLLGCGCWAVVALSSLLVQSWTGQM